MKKDKDFKFKVGDMVRVNTMDNKFFGTTAEVVYRFKLNDVVDNAKAVLIHQDEDVDKKMLDYLSQLKEADQDTRFYYLHSPDINLGDQVFEENELVLIHTRLGS